MSEDGQVRTSVGSEFKIEGAEPLKSHGSKGLCELSAMSKSGGSMTNDNPSRSVLDTLKTSKVFLCDCVE